MNALAHFFPAIRHLPPYWKLGLTRHFFLSGLVLAAAFAYLWLWSVVAQWLWGDDLFAIGGAPNELAAALHGGGLVAVLGLVGFLWLFLTGFAARGTALRQRDHRIAELEAKLSELSHS